MDLFFFFLFLFFLQMTRRWRWVWSFSLVLLSAYLGVASPAENDSNNVPLAYGAWALRLQSVLAGKMLQCARFFERDWLSTAIELQSRPNSARLIEAEMNMILAFLRADLEQFPDHYHSLLRASLLSESAAECIVRALPHINAETNEISPVSWSCCDKEAVGDDGQIICRNEVQRVVARIQCLQTDAESEFQAQEEGGDGLRLHIGAHAEDKEAEGMCVRAVTVVAFVLDLVHAHLVPHLLWSGGGVGFGQWSGGGGVVAISWVPRRAFAATRLHGLLYNSSSTLVDTRGASSYMMQSRGIAEYVAQLQRALHQALCVGLEFSVFLVADSWVTLVRLWLEFGGGWTVLRLLDDLTRQQEERFRGALVILLALVTGFYLSMFFIEVVFAIASIANAVVFFLLRLLFKKKRGAVATSAPAIRAESLRGVRGAPVAAVAPRAGACGIGGNSSKKTQ